ncbi:MAG: STAS domain-containing protein [Deltaproteobacteria bacterium]|nr:STAS domain-containing protein [Deltaproteobacteria bacterium]
MSEQRIVKSLADDGKTATVTLKGVLNIEAAAALHRELGGALSEAPLVVLDVRQLEELDMTILQTLCSACKTAAATGHGLRFASEVPASIKALSGGIGAHMGSPCRQNNDETCILFGGAR